MTLDELSSLARRAYVTSESSNVLDGWRATVLAVLDAVERECVPEEAMIEEDADDAYTEGVGVGWDGCREEVLAKLSALRGNDEV